MFRLSISNLLDPDKMSKVNSDNEKYKSRVYRRLMKEKSIRERPVTRKYRTKLDKQFWKEHFAWARGIQKHKIRKEEFNQLAKEPSKRKFRRCPKIYDNYINSIFWENRRNKFFQKFGKKCKICGSAKFVQLHHVLYGNFGKEKDENLLALCKDHHKEFHEKYGRGKGDFRNETTEFLKAHGLQVIHFSLSLTSL